VRRRVGKDLLYKYSSYYIKEKAIKKKIFLLLLHTFPLIKRMTFCSFCLNKEKAKGGKICLR
jgi:hypothetical protein